MHNLGIEVLIQSDISGHPHCLHGPTLLFERFTKDDKKIGRRYYACSACRDRKDCSFFQWEDDKISNFQKKSSISIGKENQTNYSERMKKFIKLANSQKKFCKTCSLLLLPYEYKDHYKHDILNMSKEQLEKPSYIILPLENKKKEAQYLFSGKEVSFIVECIKNLKYKKVICIGTPRIHEYIHFKENCNCQSILLDIDDRYKQFYSPEVFFHYNMFNNYFFDGETSMKLFNEFLNTSKREIVIVIDPPFGGLVDALVHTVKAISSEWNQTSSLSDEIPVMWFFPYFLEPRVTDAMPSLNMLDYKVDYENHPLFHNGLKGRKQGSPVRIFTNVKPSAFMLPKEEGYRYCKLCKKYIYKENKHCYLCNACTSKDGRPYKHCKICNRCVKETYLHCNRCNSCALNNHKCNDVNRQSSCHRCGKQGHKRKNCSEDLNCVKRKKKQ